MKHAGIGFSKIKKKSFQLVEYYNRNINNVIYTLEYEFNRVTLQNFFSQ